VSALSEIKTILTDLNIPTETGLFSPASPSTYAVLVPLTDSFMLHGDDFPGVDVQEIRISLFSKNSYTTVKNSIVSALLATGFAVTERMYVGYEPDTGYHHYAVDAAKHYLYQQGGND